MGEQMTGALPTMPRLILSFCMLTALALIANCQQDGATGPNPFAGFETIRLPNGLKLWYKRTPDSADTAISLVVPYGSDEDPAGKEGLAHFTEHMLFADHLGRSEEQIKREIEDLGGVRNGFTFPDHTAFFVHIGNQHGPFAIEWLSKLTSPHTMEPDVVERQREPVLQETGARRRQLFDWIQALYLNPPMLRPKNFWKREFGLDTPESRDVDPFRSIDSISSHDLSWFYDTYYIPSRMTLAVIGNLDRGQVLKKVQETFGLFSSRASPSASGPVTDPALVHREFYWDFSANPFYRQLFKVYDPAAEDFVRLVFLSRLLGKRLNDHLRFGDRKATYGMTPFVTRRGPATILNIQGGIDKDQYSYARSVIDREIATVRGDGYSDDEFNIDHATISRQLRTTYNSPKELEWWVLVAFYDPDMFSDYPDLSSAFDNISKKELQAFARRVLVPEREVLTITRPIPLTDGTLVLIGLVLLILVIRAARFVLISPIEMPRIRYVARFRIPIAFRILTLGGLLAFVALTGRLLVFGCQLLSDKSIVRVEGFWVQGSIYTLMAAASLFLLILLISSLPRKVLVFDDRLVVKYLAYRSRSIAVNNIIEASLRRFREVWLSRRLWRCLPLTTGLFSPGIYLVCKNGAAMFFQVRDRQEFLAVLKQVTDQHFTMACVQSPSELDR